MLTEQSALDVPMHPLLMGRIGMTRSQPFAPPSGIVQRASVIAAAPPSAARQKKTTHTAAVVYKDYDEAIPRHDESLQKVESCVGPVLQACGPMLQRTWEVEPHSQGPARTCGLMQQSARNV